MHKNFINCASIFIQNFFLSLFVSFTIRILLFIPINLFRCRVRIWDVAILIPNLLFLLFIAVRFNRARLKLRATSSPIFLAFYGLVICNVVISVIRCVVSMTANAAGSVGGKADKVLWVTVRFFLLSTEMSVVIFCLAFGGHYYHMKSIAINPIYVRK